MKPTKVYQYMSPYKPIGEDEYGSTQSFFANWAGGTTGPPRVRTGGDLGPLGAL